MLNWLGLLIIIMKCLTVLYDNSTGSVNHVQIIIIEST